MSEISIAKGVGVALNAAEGTIININLSADKTTSSGSDTDQELIRQAVRELLTLCVEADLKLAMQRISNKLFGSSFFKSLSLEQLEKLQMIANEIVNIRKSSMTIATENNPKQHEINGLSESIKRLFSWLPFVY